MDFELLNKRIEKGFKFFFGVLMPLSLCWLLTTTSKYNLFFQGAFKDTRLDSRLTKEYQNLIHDFELISIEGKSFFDKTITVTFYDKKNDKVIKQRYVSDAPLLGGQVWLYASEHNLIYASTFDADLPEQYQIAKLILDGAVEAIDDYELSQMEFESI